jgi:hypothetical protein
MSSFKRCGASRCSHESLLHLLLGVVLGVAPPFIPDVRGHLDLDLASHSLYSLSLS